MAHPGLKSPNTVKPLGEQHRSANMSEEIKRRMEGDFLPEPSSSALSQNDGRMTDAAEYIAYHLGQIDKKLDRLIAILEASANKS
jgi:hypothetical protein